MLSMSVNMRSSQHIHCLLQCFTARTLLSPLLQFRRKQSKNPKLLKVLQKVLEHHDFHQIQHLSSPCFRGGFDWFVLTV